MQKKIASLFIIAATLLLTACATHVKMDTADQQAIKTVNVDPNISKPPVAYAFASGQEFGLIGGVLFKKNADNLAKQAQEIDISKLVYKEWISQLKDKNIQVANHSQNVLTAKIIMYGVSIPHGFSNDYVPAISIEAKLVRDNKVIWQDRESSLTFSSDNSANYDTLMADPKNMEKLLSYGTKKVINKLIADMYTQ